MKIVIMTNVYTPFVGGVERSVQTFAGEYERMGHEVLIVAPEFKGRPADENNVIRLPAIQNFNHTDFSVQLPIPSHLNSALRKFAPDLVHSQHPFLIGDTALRVAARLGVPLVYTFHTFYEEYTHYVPADSRALKKFVIALTAGYCNLADLVFAPSRSAARVLRARGVTAPMKIVPTGIDVKTFSAGDRRRVRAELGIGEKDFVLGTVSRLAKEKNLDFLVRVVADFLESNPGGRFILIGAGPLEEAIASWFAVRGLSRRIHNLGILERRELGDAYCAMDAFLFASETETQGIVIAEAMAAGVPVVALEATGVSDVVVDKINGRRVWTKEPSAFLAAIQWLAGLDNGERARLCAAARATGEQFSKETCASRALLFYQDVLAIKRRRPRPRQNPWEEAKRSIRAEWEIVRNMASATREAIRRVG